MALYLGLLAQLVAVGTPIVVVTGLLVQWIISHEESKMSNLGDAPIDKLYRDQMNAIMEVLDETFNGNGRPRKVGIVLWVFPYGTVEGRANYISNGADRRDMITLMKEQIARFEGQPAIKGEA